MIRDINCFVFIFTKKSRVFLLSIVMFERLKRIDEKKVCFKLNDVF